MRKATVGARERLQQAALELFAERGYDDTKAVDIATRAGVTERTFFRHFPDKREVLFDGQEVLSSMLTDAIASAPQNADALTVLFHAFSSVVAMLEANRPFSKPRQNVISQTPALQERELTKHELLARVLAQALVERGVDDLSATLAAKVGMAAFVHATLLWLENPVPTLGKQLKLARGALNDLLEDRSKS
ncbi:TetR/AcrR family transcriptional regulator [Gallaecimonas mangrovi]|uniref:TetR/AcrR family transcriptional regulator n=1 Tax=Gallaecimonas mangrovi TaxID=2291597 RepID=UPI000E1FC794|nr:TetR/AcrR family transcriptional regulator [Gallaecimonas mangrovi]